MSKTHIQRWAPQDWRTSRVRMRSAMTGDTVLRLVYRELLDSLHEHGGRVSADPAWLADDLLLPAGEIQRCLPLLVELGSVEIEGGIVRNRRVSRELQEEQEFRQIQSELGRRGGRAKAKARRGCSDGQANAKPPLSPPTPPPPPPPLPTPVTERIPARTAAPAKRQARKLPVDSAGAVADACEDWSEILGGVAPGGRIAGAWPAMLALAPWADVRPTWRWYLAQGKASGKAEFCKPQDFAERLDYWRQRARGEIASPARGAPAGRRLTAAEQTMQSMREHERITGLGGRDGRADHGDGLPERVVGPGG